MNTKTRSGSFLPQKVAQDGISKKGSFLTDSNTDSKNFILEKTNKEKRIHIKVTEEDLNAINRIDDFLKEKGIERMATGKIIRLALHCALVEESKLDLNALVEKLRLSDGRIKR